MCFILLRNLCSKHFSLDKYSGISLEIGTGTGVLFVCSLNNDAASNSVYIWLVNACTLSFKVSVLGLNSLFWRKQKGIYDCLCIYLRLSISLCITSSLFLKVYEITLLSVYLPQIFSSPKRSSFCPCYFPIFSFSMRLVSWKRKGAISSSQNFLFLYYFFTSIGIHCKFQ
jgi:hypothetical protein